MNPESEVIDELLGMSVKELRDIAKYLGVVGYSKAVKSELQKRIFDKMLEKLEEDERIGDCLKENKKNVELAAKSYGIKTRGKTKKQLCEEIKKLGVERPAKVKKTEKLDLEEELEVELEEPIMVPEEEEVDDIGKYFSEEELEDFRKKFGKSE